MLGRGGGCGRSFGLGLGDDTDTECVLEDELGEDGFDVDDHAGKADLVLLHEEGCGELRRRAEPISK